MFVEEQMRGDWQLTKAQFCTLFGADCNEQTVDLRFEVDGELMPVSKMKRKNEGLGPAATNIARLVVHTAASSATSKKPKPPSVLVPENRSYKDALDGLVQVGWRVEWEAPTKPPRLVVILTQPTPEVAAQLRETSGRHRAISFLASSSQPAGTVGGDAPAPQAKPLGDSVYKGTGLIMPVLVFRQLFDPQGGERRPDGSLWKIEGLTLEFKGAVPRAISPARIPHCSVTVNRSPNGQIGAIKIGGGLTNAVKKELVGLRVVKWSRPLNDLNRLILELADD